jgi:hypothetical protein
MHVGELLFRLSEAGITLRCGRTEDRLNAKPTSALTPGLVEEILQGETIRQNLEALWDRFVLAIKGLRMLVPRSLRWRSKLEEEGS